MCQKKEQNKKIVIDLIPKKNSHIVAAAAAVGNVGEMNNGSDMGVNNKFALLDRK
jgi:hypothetical protein